MMAKDLLNRTGAVLVLAAALLAPLPFGSQSLFWSMLWVAVLAAPALLLDPARLGFVPRLAVALLVATAAAVAAVAVLQQAIPPSGGHRIWAQASQVLGEPLAERRGVSARWPHADLAPAAAAALAFLGGLFLSARRIGSRRLLVFVAAVGGAYASLWLLLHAADPKAVLWRPKLHHDNVLTGTFLNRNMAAAFLGPPLVACALLAADVVFRGLIGVRLLRRGRRAGRWESHAVLPFVLAPPIAVALLLTGSRAGVALAAAGCVAAVALLALPAAAALDRKARRIMVGAFAAGAMAALAFVLAVVGSRFDASEVVDQHRFAVYRLTWRMAADHPAIGVGLGQFGNVFQAYRDATVPGLGVWDRAHNTYLQVAAEAGLPVLGLALATVATVFAGLAAGVARGGAGRVAALFGAVSLAMPMLHSLVDYPAQIPGYAIPLCVLAGYALGLSRGIDGRPRG
jgi:O-antigen ligase